MTPNQIVSRNPRLATVLMSINADDDVSWAAAILKDARLNKHSFAHMLVKEAWRKRKSHRNDPQAKYLVGEAMKTAQKETT